MRKIKLLFLALVVSLSVSTQAQTLTKPAGAITWSPQWYKTADSLYVMSLANLRFYTIPTLGQINNATNSIKNDFTVNIPFFKSYIAYPTKEHPRSSGGTVIKLTNGKYYIAYTRYNNSYLDASPSSIVGKTSTDGNGSDWENETVIQENIGTINTIANTLVRINSTTVHLYIIVQNSSTDTRIYRKVSTDDCVTWGSPTLVLNDGGYMQMVSDGISRGNGNRLIVPISFTPNANIVSNPYSTNYVWYSDDNGTTWNKSNEIVAACGSYNGTENSVAQLSGNNLIMIMRTQCGSQYTSTSSNNGATWTTPLASNLVSSASPAKVVMIGSNLVALHNNSTSGDSNEYRRYLTFSKSTNSGSTWAVIKNLDGRDASAPYYSNYSDQSILIDGNYLVISYWERLGSGDITLKFAKINKSELGL